MAEMAEDGSILCHILVEKVNRRRLSVLIYGCKNNNKDGHC
jgi:hypothetical protein